MRFFCHFRVLFLCALMVACGSNPPKEPVLELTTQDIQQATDITRLEEARAKLDRLMQDQKPENTPEPFALAASIDRRLAQLHHDRVQAQIEASRISEPDAFSDLVPLPALQEIEQQVRANPAITEQYLPKILGPVRKEQAVTFGVINLYLKESQQDKLGAERRALVYHYLYLLSGDAKWRAGRDKQMEIIIAGIRSAQDQKLANNALEDKVDFVRSVYPTEPADIVDEMIGVYADIYLQRYRNALAAENLDRAHKVIKKLHQKPDFEQISAALKPQKEKMVSAYNALVEPYIAQPNHLPQSYRWHTKEIEIRAILDTADAPSRQTSALVQQLLAHYQQAEEQNRPAAALGILLAVEALQPNLSRLQSRIEKQEAHLQSASVRRIAIEPLRSRHQQGNYGAMVSELVADYLTESLPHELVVLSVQSSSPLDREVDFSFDGYVLQAKVEQTQTRDRRMMDAGVGQEKEPNPEFIAWLEQPPKKRAKLERPDEYLLVDKTEKVAVGYTIHRKVGTFAVSYRLIETEGERVLLPDSITLQKAYKDESTAGFELRDFTIPAKDAELPSDDEILSEMAKDMAGAISKNLEPTLAAQEQLYLQAAEEFAQQRQCDEEIESLAKALTLMKMKGKQVEATADRLRLASVACL